MPAALSKETVTDEAALVEEKLARQKRVVKLMFWAVFQSVCQHMITLQSEPMLIKEICKGSASASMQMLANSQGLVGLLGLMLNQVGGKFSDVLGRKAGLILGPLGNIFLGQFVYHNPGSRFVVLTCRVLRMVITTFSNTVMVTAALSDVCSGKDLAMASSLMAASTGLGLVLTPFVEARILQRSSPRFAYLALSVLGAVQVVYNVFVMPETLEIAKRIPMQAALTLQNFNPFGFMRIFTHGSKGLCQMTTVATLQMAIEGKNMSDLSQVWMKNHLGWTIEGARNFVISYGMLCVASGMSLTPYLLRTLSPRAFTTLTNLFNFLGFAIRGRQGALFFILGVLPMLPGVNGSSASALKALSSDRATAEGFGKGEFSAWSNNLRALMGSLAPVIYGNYYAFALRKGLPAGTVFILAGILGAGLPEVLLRFIKDEDLKPVPPAALPTLTQMTTAPRGALPAVQAK